MPLRNLIDWKNDFPNRNHVQPEEHNRAEEGSFLSGESAVVVAGPPQLATSQTTSSLIPVGLVQQAQLSQNKQLNQIFEIGGRVPFYVPSRVSIRASLSRILFDGPSLFYALYQRKDLDSSTVPPRATFSTGFSSSLNDPTAPYNDEGIVSRPQTTGVAQEDSDPGLFWSNLGSGIFNRPMGLGFVLFDMEGEPFGGAYLEKCFVQTHNFGISANATVLAENVTLVATKLRPLNAATIAI